MRRRGTRARSRATRPSASRAGKRRRCARISPKVTKALVCRATFAAVFATLGAAVSARAGSSLADVDAAARAAGNRKPAAVAIGRSLFAEVRPVQILKVRVDGVGDHEVAGLVLSGVKFHTPVDARAFAREVAELVRATFAASAVEEVDVWATVPLRVGQHAVVAGDKAEPTSRIVYGLTVRRPGNGALDAAAADASAYWDLAWRAGLQAP